MELRQLRTFVMAAELESFTRAAERLEVTQPAVSQQVAALELELGVSLFQRRGPKISLTESGRYMYRYASKALGLLERASSQVGRAEVEVSGAIAIASCSVPTETFLPELIASFRQAYPKVTEVVSVSDAIAASKAVQNGEADLGFTVVPPRGAQLSATEILCHELVLVCSAEHSFATEDHLDSDSLRRAAFVLRDRSSGTRFGVEQAMADIGIDAADLTIALETNSDEAVRGAIRKNVGLGFLSRSAVADDLSHGRLIELKVDGLHVRQSVYLVVDPSRIASAAVRAFLGFVKS